MERKTGRHGLIVCFSLRRPTHISHSRNWDIKSVKFMNAFRKWDFTFPITGMNNNIHYKQQVETNKNMA